MMRGNSTRRTRGSSVIAVLASFIFIGGALTAMTALFVTESRRTQATMSGAQVRQLLMAAAPAAQAELRMNGTGERDVPMATPVTAAQVMMHIKPVGEGKVEVRVRVKVGNGMGTQTLKYGQSGDEWRVESATISGQP